MFDDGQATYYIVSSLGRFFEKYLGMRPDSWFDGFWGFLLILPFAFSVYLAIGVGLIWSLLEFGLLLIEAFGLENNLAFDPPTHDSLVYFPLYFLPDIF